MLHSTAGSHNELTDDATASDKCTQMAPDVTKQRQEQSALAAQAAPAVAQEGTSSNSSESSRSDVSPRRRSDPPSAPAAQIIEVDSSADTHASESAPHQQPRSDSSVKMELQRTTTRSTKDASETPSSPMDATEDALGSSSNQADDTIGTGDGASESASYQQLISDTSAASEVEHTNTQDASETLSSLTKAESALGSSPSQADDAITSTSTGTEDMAALPILLPPSQSHKVSVAPVPATESSWTAGEMHEPQFSVMSPPTSPSAVLLRPVTPVVTDTIEQGRGRIAVEPASPTLPLPVLRPAVEQTDSPIDGALENSVAAELPHSSSDSRPSLPAEHSEHSDQLDESATGLNDKAGLALSSTSPACLAEPTDKAEIKREEGSPVDGDISEQPISPSTPPMPMSRNVSIAEAPHETPEPRSDHSSVEMPRSPPSHSHPLSMPRQEAEPLAHNQEGERHSTAADAQPLPSPPQAECCHSGTSGDTQHRGTADTAADTQHWAHADTGVDTQHRQTANADADQPSLRESDPPSPPPLVQEGKQHSTAAEAQPSSSPLQAARRHNGAAADRRHRGSADSDANQPSVVEADAPPPPPPLISQFSAAAALQGIHPPSAERSPSGTGTDTRHQASVDADVDPPPPPPPLIPQFSAAAVPQVTQPPSAFSVHMCWPAQQQIAVSGSQAGEEYPLCPIVYRLELQEVSL